MKIKYIKKLGIQRWPKAFDWMNVPHMKRSLAPSTGTGTFWPKSAKTLRLCQKGCANRPFYQIVCMERRKNQFEPVIEQIGTYDPMPNKDNQVMVSMNTERIRHWIGQGAHISKPVAEILGIAGLLPVYPKIYMNAWRRRMQQQQLEEESKSKEAAAEASSS